MWIVTRESAFAIVSLCGGVRRLEPVGMTRRAGIDTIGACMHERESRRCALADAVAA
jgi:hypothetical protein